MDSLYQDFLAHHGVKGQRWGVRRYQNEDGTLTSAGKAKYGKMKERSDNDIIRKTIGSEFGYRVLNTMAQRRQDRKIQKYEARGNEAKAKKWRSKKEAYNAARQNLEAYRNHASAGTLAAQNASAFIVGFASSAYRHARARGSTRAQAFLETIPIVNIPVRIINDRKAYGHFVFWSDMDGEGV